MGAYHAGLLNGLKSFNECLSDPALSGLKGCVKPAQKYSQGIWVDYPTLEVPIRGKMYRFFRHPELYLIPAVSVMIAEANHDIDRQAVDSFDLIGAREQEAYSLYRDALETCRKIKEALSG